MHMKPDTVIIRALFAAKTRRKRYIVLSRSRLIITSILIGCGIPIKFKDAPVSKKAVYYFSTSNLRYIKKLKAVKEMIYNAR